MFCMLRVNVRQFRIKTRCGITSVSFGITNHFPDLHHIHENSADTLALNTTLSIYLKYQIMINRITISFSDAKKNTFVKKSSIWNY